MSAEHYYLKNFLRSSLELSQEILKKPYCNETELRFLEDLSKLETLNKFLSKVGSN
ncbi:hypothetical protein HSE3_gp050 [Bacillus phage vB_BceM-HSE3]|nr:hypothetical protein HSE3_gp050 [Bacillus phage vB_BceM-HSE3]